MGISDGEIRHLLTETREANRRQDSLLSNHYAFVLALEELQQLRARKPKRVTTATLNTANAEHILPRQAEV